jgi:hypothetical protein
VLQHPATTCTLSSQPTHRYRRQLASWPASSSSRDTQQSVNSSSTPCTRRSRPEACPTYRWLPRLLLLPASSSNL